jgi:hypothetical protein
MRGILRPPGALILGAVLILAGCVAVPVGGYYGEWYAPYGQRYVTSEGMVVTYQSGLGAYLVVGQPGLYWWNGYYYRRHGGYWERSHHHRGPWVYRPADRVPFLAHRRGSGPGRPPGRTWARPGAPPRGHFPTPRWGTSRGAGVPQSARLEPPQSRRPPPGRAPQGWEVTRREQRFRSLPEAWRHGQAQKGGPFPQVKSSPGNTRRQTPPGQGQHGRAPTRGWRPHCPPGKNCDPKGR